MEVTLKKAHVIRLTENVKICRSRAFRLVKYGVQRACDELSRIVPSLHAMSGDIARPKYGRKIRTGRSAAV